MHLAKVLRSGGNVLLLDEPTNDLDVEINGQCSFSQLLEQVTFAIRDDIEPESGYAWTLKNERTEQIYNRNDDDKSLEECDIQRGDRIFLLWRKV